MDSLLGILFGIAAMVGWGTADFFVAKAVRKTTTIKVLFWSQIITLLLAVVAFWLFFSPPALSAETIGIILLCSILSIVSWGAFYKGLQIGKVAVVSPIVNTWPAITVILSIIFLGETLTLVQGAGVCLAIIGTVLASFKLHDLAKLKNPAKGAKYALVGLLGWGVMYVFLDTLVERLGWFFPLLFIKIASVLYLSIYFTATKKDFSFPRVAVSFVVLVGAFEMFAALFYGLGVTYQYTAIVAPIVAGVPTVTILLAKVFFKETVEFNQKIGIGSILTGVVLLAL